MTNDVWAAAAVLGFGGLSLVAAYACAAAILSVTPNRVRGVLLALGGICILLAIVAAINRLALPPFGWISPHTVIVADGIIIWVVFLGVLCCLGCWIIEERRG